MFDKRKAMMGMVWMMMFFVVSGCATKNEDLAISPGSRVFLSYSLKVNGESAGPENAPQGMSLEVGGKAYPVAFENALVGLKVGHTKTISLKPEEAFGPVRLDKFDRIPKKLLPKDINLKEGAILSGQVDASGKPMLGRIVKLLTDSVVIDRNHPLAGKALEYQIKIVRVE